MELKNGARRIIVEQLMGFLLRIALRFHSHCPQTTRLYYHRPSKHHDDHHGSDHTMVQDPNRMEIAVKAIDTCDHLIFYSVV